MAVLLLVLMTGLLSACKGGDSTGSNDNSNPKPCHGCNPAPVDNDLAKLTGEGLTQIHQELRILEARSGLGPNDWSKISGWKLFVVLGQHMQLNDASLGDRKNARLFFTLHQALHESDGQVKLTIDTKEIIAELIREYFK